MKFLFGDFAAGFAEGASEQFAEKRKRNENLINAGIERAMTQGTELWKERNERAKVVAQRSQDLRDLHPDLSSQEIAALAGTSEDVYNQLIERTMSYAELGVDAPEFFGGDPQAIDARVAAEGEKIHDVLTDPAMTGVLTRGQADRVADSFQSKLRTGFMQAGVISATPDFLQSRVMKEAAALMPEVDDPEELRRLLSGEEDVTSTQTLAELGFKLPPDLASVQAYNVRNLQLTSSTAAQTISQAQMLSNIPKINNIRAVEALFPVDNFDAEGQPIFAGAGANPTTQRSIAASVRDDLTKIYQTLNLTEKGNESNQLTLITNRANAAVSVLGALAIKEHTDRAGSTNTVGVTLQDLYEAGATSEDINAYEDEFKVATEPIDVGYTFFNERGDLEVGAQEFVPESLQADQLGLSDASRMDAIRSLAILRNLYKTEGGERGTRAGSEGIFQGQLNLTESAVDSLIKYFEAIRDGRTRPRNRDEIVRYYSHQDATIDINNPWGVMQSFFDFEAETNRD